MNKQEHDRLLNECLNEAVKDFNDRMESIMETFEKDIIWNCEILRVTPKMKGE